ncbi:SdpI family protein [Vaginisenegalia massiliensis]|uniref:SdpI family protein n=1 Tax=Vaginisenegalia massiliensis TaxID=2058294 RepID=UPI000F52B9CC|nr:SdpI family protein [Vaginisenegalia massiliensis]
MRTYIPRGALKNWVLFAIALVVALYFYPSLPNQIATHFNFDGQVDEYGSKSYIFLAPAIILGMNLLGEVIKRIDPKHSNYQRFEPTYYWLFFLIGCLMLITQVMTILVANNIDVEVNKIMLASIAILFIGLGNIMPKIKHNFSTGIKTPWTIADERVWYLTHRLGGKCMIGGGLVFLLGLLLPQTWLGYLFAVAMIIAVGIPTVASYFYFQRLQNK